MDTAIKCNDFLASLEVKNVSNYREGLEYLNQNQNNTAAKYLSKHEYLINEVALFEIIGEFVAYKLIIPRSTDITSNFQTENVHHVELMINDVVSEHKTDLWVAVRSPYCEISLRLFFIRDQIPKTFSVNYECLLLNGISRKEFAMLDKVVTETHSYSGGMMKDL